MNLQRQSILFSTALPSLIIAVGAQGEFLPKLAGRVEVLVFENACILDSSITEEVSCRSTPALEYSALDSVIRQERSLETRGRIEAEVVDLDELLEFGAFARLEFDAAAKKVTDTDGHLFFKSDWGKLQLGTDIDADQGSFDTDFHKEGPLRIQREVTAAKSVHTFDNDDYGEVSFVYTTPSWSGLTLAIELDEKTRGAASFRLKNQVVGMDYSLGGAIDSAGAMGANFRLDRGAFSLAGYAGRDWDGEFYVGGGAGYEYGALRLTGEAGYMASDTNDDQGFAREVQLVAGAGYQAFRTVEASGSVQWFSTTRREDQASPEYSLNGVKAAARLRVDF